MDQIQQKRMKLDGNQFSNQNLLSITLVTLYNNNYAKIESYIFYYISDSLINKDKERNLYNLRGFIIKATLRDKTEAQIMTKRKSGDSTGSKPKTDDASAAAFTTAATVMIAAAATKQPEQQSNKRKNGSKNRRKNKKRKSDDDKKGDD